MAAENHSYEGSRVPDCSLSPDDREFAARGASYKTLMTVRTVQILYGTNIVRYQYCTLQILHGTNTVR